MHRLSHRSALLLFVCAWMAAGSASAEVTGYTGRNHEIVALDLRTSGGAVQGDRWALFASDEDVLALDLDPAGTLYAVTEDDADQNRLYTVDLGTESATELASLGPVRPIDLAFDDDGLLWIATYQDLYTYDVDTGILTLITTLVSDNFGGIDFQQGDLYVVLRPENDEVGPLFGIMDPADGSLIQSRELPGFTGTGYQFFGFSGLDFDDDGGLWLGVRGNLGLIAPPCEALAAYLSDPWTSDTQLGSVSFNCWPRVPLVVTGAVTAVEVPTASSIGLAILAAVLGALAIATLGRRRQV